MSQGISLMMLMGILGILLCASYIDEDRLKSLSQLISRLRSVRLRKWFFAPPDFTPGANHFAQAGIGVTYSQWGRLNDLDTRDHVFVVTATRYTSYTLIAVPALLYKTGAFGYYTVIYSLLTNVLALTLGKFFWDMMHPPTASQAEAGMNAAKTVVYRPFGTAVDIIDDRYDDQPGTLPLSIAVTLVKIGASIAYLALQIYAIDLLIECLGIKSDVPLILLFLIFALFVYAYGLQPLTRLAAMKVVLLTVVSLPLVIFIIFKMGGVSHIFHLISTVHPHLLILSPHQFPSFITLAVTSVLAFWLYPHNTLALASARDEPTFQQSMLRAPIFVCFTLFFALLGFAAITTTFKLLPFFQENSVLPLLIQRQVPWLVIPIFGVFIYSALVSALSMSVACGNLFAQHIYIKWQIHRKHLIPAEQDIFMAARMISLLVKVSAVGVMLIVLQTSALQLIVNLFVIGNIIMLQVIPALFFGWRFGWSAQALLVGLASGLIFDIWLGIPTLSNAPLVGNIGFGVIPPVNIGLIGLGVNFLFTFFASLFWKPNMATSEI